MLHCISHICRKYFDHIHPLLKLLMIYVCFNLRNKTEKNFVDVCVHVYLHAPWEQQLLEAGKERPAPGTGVTGSC